MRRGGYTGEKTREHLEHYYRWNAGLDPGDYRQTFAQFRHMYLDTPQLYSSDVIEWYTGRVGPFVRSQPSILRYITLPISIIPPDAFILAGICGIFVMAGRDWRLLFLLGLSMAPIYVAAVSATVVGDNRYAHLLWPFASVA